jgi:multisubunit Na+/H+ antiporter MnhC subunit
MRIINFVVGLALIGAGVYGLYVTLAEQRRADRPSTATRIVRAVLALLVLTAGVLAVLTAARVFYKGPPHF